MEEIEDQPGLADDERAFEIEGGERVAVSVRRTQLSGGSIALRGRARLIDEEGETLEACPGEPCCTPAVTRTLHREGLATGRLGAKTQLALFYADCVQRLRDYRGAMRALYDLPVLDENDNSEES